jgi:D-amino-acid dehydrogenase
MDAATPPVIVVGGGIVGLATAAHLLRSGARVMVIDRRGPGEATSFGNAGGLSETSTLPMAMPGILKDVPRWLIDPDGPLHVRPRYLPKALPFLLRFLRETAEPRVRRNAKALIALHRHCLNDLMPLVQWAGAEHLIVVPAHLHLFRTRAGYDKDTLSHELRVATGRSMELLDGREIRGEEPHLAPIFELGLRMPGNGYCRSPLKLSQAIAAKFVADGGEILRSDVMGFVTDEGRIAAVRTDRGNLAASQVVVAAGIWSRRLVEQLGESLPLESQRGYHVSIKQPNVSVTNMCGVGFRKVALTPMDDGLRVAGTVEFAGLEPLPEHRRVEPLLAAARELLPALDIRDYSEWMGHRPCLPDSLPVIDRSRRYGNVFFAFGHGHQGLIGSGPTGRIIADMALGRDPGINLRPYAIDRFGHRPTP